jgi:predicted enzyme related to lactoylglutathione lyase
MDLLLNIDVRDLEKGIAFYRDALGLKEGRRLFNGESAEMLGSTVRIYLLEEKPGSLPFPAAAQGNDYKRHWTPIHPDFLVPDLDRAVQKALDHGAKKERESELFPWGRIAHLCDPFGHGFCLIQFFGSGY